jgi:hypothetical protein
MTVGMYVKVPEPLADSLAANGFREGGSERGVEVFVSDAEILIGTVSNLVTVFVARHEVSRFIEHIWASVRHRKPDSPNGVTVVLQRGSQRVAITLEHEGFDDETPPRKVVRAMSALLEALADADKGLPANEP